MQRRLEKELAKVGMRNADVISIFLNPLVRDDVVPDEFEDAARLDLPEGAVTVEDCDGGESVF